MKNSRLWSTWSLIRNYETSRAFCPEIVLNRNRKYFMWTGAVKVIFYKTSFMEKTIELITFRVIFTIINKISEISNRDKFHLNSHFIWKLVTLTTKVSCDEFSLRKRIQRLTNHNKWFDNEFQRIDRALLFGFFDHLKIWIIPSKKFSKSFWIVQRSIYFNLFVRKNVHFR